MLAYPPLLSQSYRNAVLNSVGLVGSWGLHETAGTVAKDETGKDGAYVATPTLGVAGLLSKNPGTAVTFNGSSQYVTIPVAVVLGDVFTLVAWLRRNRTATGETIIDSATGSVSFQFNASDQLQMVKGGVGIIGTSTPIIAETTTIHMVAWSHNVGANSAYLDQVVTNVTSATTGLSMTGGFIASSNGFGRLGATMAEVAIWNRVVAGAELSNLYRIGRGF